MSAVTSAIACVVLFGLPPGAPRTASHRAPLVEMIDAARYVRANRSLGLVALTTIGVVVIGFPYLTFLPALADERYGVGAGGYGLMAGVAGLGAVLAGIVVPRRGWIVERPWRTIAVAGVALGLALIGLGLASWFWLALADAGGRRSGRAGVPDDDAIVDAGALRQRVPRSDAEHGRARLQWLRARRAPARPAGRRLTLELTLAAMGVVVLAVTAVFVLKRRRHRRELVSVELA